MVALEKLTDEEFDRFTLDLLKRELGVEGLTRFLSLHSKDTGDYTRDRHQWQRHLSVEDISESILHRRAHIGSNIPTPVED